MTKIMTLMIVTSCHSNGNGTSHCHWAQNIQSHLPNCL